MQENQPPDRFGQHGVQFGEQFDESNLSPQTRLQRRMYDIDDLARRLELIHRARKSAVLVSVVRDAAYHRAMARVNEVLAVAGQALGLPAGAPTSRFAIRRATVSADSLIEQLQALLAHPTGKTT